MHDVFGPNGKLASLLSGYQPRHSQLELVDVVSRALREGRHALLEAPVGTGKSLAYLVPLAEALLTYEAHEQAFEAAYGAPPLADLTKYKAFVVTANINLQEQLINKDLPLVQRMKPALKTALAKGVSNFVCERTLVEKRPHRVRLKLVDEKAQSQINAIVRKYTDYSDWSGDKAGLEFEPVPEAWRAVSTTSAECHERACSYRARCAYYAQRSAWAQAHVIVTNYHMYYSGIAHGADIFPEHQVVVFDEAHRAAEIGRDMLGKYVSRRQVTAALKALTDSIFKEGALLALNSVFDSLHAFSEDREYRGYIHSTPAGLGIDMWDSFLTILSEASARLRDAALASSYSADPVHRHASNLTRAREALWLVGNPGDTNHVFSIEGVDAESVALRSKAVDISEIFADELLKNKTGLLLSATLTTNESFDFIRGELGMASLNVLLHRVSSAFNLATQSIFMVDPSIPAPTSDTRNNHLDASTSIMLRAMRACGGRTLALFTSRYAMEFARRALVASNPGFTILVQGEHSRAETIRRFKEDVTSVLLGLGSYWEGIDVPGEALSCLFMDKLPFAGGDDPLLRWYTDTCDDWFVRYALPRAITMFRQGTGRLIRSVTDQGLFVFTDPRLVTKDYGEAFLVDFRNVCLIDSSQLERAAAHLQHRRLLVAKEGA